MEQHEANGLYQLALDHQLSDLQTGRILAEIVRHLCEGYGVLPDQLKEESAAHTVGTVEEEEVSEGEQPTPEPITRRQTARTRATTHKEGGNE